MRRVLAASLGVLAVLAPLGCANLDGLTGGSGGDAGAEARVPVDASHVDVSSHHPADGGKDAGKTTTGTPDVTTRDVATLDVATPEAATLDAGDAESAPFCASYPVPASANSFTCEDFDENPDADAVGYAYAFAGSTLITQSTVSYSRPNSMQATSTPPDGGSTSAFFGVGVAPGTTFTAHIEALVTELPAGTESQDILTYVFGNSPQSYLAVAISAGSSPGALEAIVDENNSSIFVEHTAVGTMSINSWFSVSLVVTYTGSGYEDTFSIDGNVVEDNQPLSSNFYAGASTAADFAMNVQTGFGYASLPGPAEVYIDNVVAFSQ
jgi:hypothetical protein